MATQNDTEFPAISPRVALFSILGFWLFYIVIVTLRASVMAFEAQDIMLLRRAVVTLFGVAVTWTLYLILRTADGKSPTIRVATAFVAAVPCAIAIAAMNYYVFNIYDPASLLMDHGDEAKKVSIFQEMAEIAISRYFFLCAWAALYLALSYAGQVRQAERRVARFERAAQAAELRSLRYQVNPHFLFNTLNSLSSLVLSERNEQAEAMILNLSNFYRSSLTGDPLEDVPLRDEVEMQRLYLDIEQVRFPDRLRTVFNIPEDLMDVCVPGLILQPLIENAIKYGVSRTSRPVTIILSAWQEGTQLAIRVHDDGDPLGDGVEKGSGIGLRNVRDRLVARFGEFGAMNWYVTEGGGFTVDLHMPLVYRGC